MGITEIDKIQDKMQEEEEKKIAKEMEKIKYNRATRRKMAKAIHHNVFTKKYKNKKSLEVAWRNFLGDEVFIQVKRAQKAYIKDQKNKLSKQNEIKNMQNLIINSMKQVGEKKKDVTNIQTAN